MIESIILLRTDSMNRRFFTWFISLLMLGVGGMAEAGALWLNNGDKISGEPGELAGGVLLWQSDSAGEIKINQLNIRFIDSEREILLQIGQETLLDACRLEVDDGKPVDPPIRRESEQEPAAEEATADKSGGQQAKHTSNKPGAGLVADKVEAVGDEGVAEENGVPPSEPVSAAPSPPAEPVPQQWVMCKERGFILANWNQVSRFFEFKPPEPDTMKASGRAMVVLEDESGNTEERTVEIDVYAEFRYQKSRHIYTFENDIETKSGTDTKDETRLSYQYDRFFTERWYWAGNGSWEENKFKDLSAKWIIGGGVGHQFFETDLLKLSFQGGLSYVDEEFSDDDLRDYPALRMATNLNWLLNEFGLRFVHTNLFYQGLNRSGNWVLETDTGLSMPILKHFKVNFLFEYDYDNYPSSSAKKEDRIWKVGFSYDWGGATGVTTR